MHKLHRDPDAPLCLKHYRHGRDPWGQITCEGKKDQIWPKLEAMQGERCAYCESDISDGRRHIDHFRSRDDFPKETFAWHNLFGSCNRKDTCGSRKDDSRRTGKYHPTDLIKPDEDDPEDFFVFVTDGTIVPRAGLSAANLRRTRETLRVFNLDAQGGSLRQMRESAVSGYLQTVQEFAELANDQPGEDWLRYLNDEIHKLIADTAHLPFATAIKHALTSVRGLA